MKKLDTPAEAEKVQLMVLRGMGPEGRLQAGMALCQASRKLLIEGVRKRHPDYNERQIVMEAIRLTLPEDLFVSAYPEARSILP
jgi:hypothetical protein